MQSFRRFAAGLARFYPFPVDCHKVGVDELADSKMNGSNRTKKLGLRLPTWGGKQHWSDYFYRAGFRIQRKFATDHYRLLDPRNRRVATGNFEDCLQAWKRIDLPDAQQDASKPVVLILHGLIRTRFAMRSLARYIERSNEFVVCNLSYASTRLSINEHAQGLASVVSNLAGQRELNFVAHSMGNIVIRHYLAQQFKKDPTWSLQNCKRMVMLGPPNQGSRLAAQFDGWPLFHWLLGRPGRELGRGWARTEQELVIPQIEFGVIAGAQRTRFSLNNPLIPRPNDLVLTVKETYLPSAADFLVLPVNHTTMMHKKTVQQATLKFLRCGRFNQDGLEFSKERWSQ